MQVHPSKIRNCLLSGAVGDALGGLGEGRSRGFSDDTQLTLACCEAILDRGEPDPAAIAEHMRRWFVSGRVTGLGSSTLKALRDLASGAHWALAGAQGERAAGNGAAMRAAPLAFFLDPASESDRVVLRDIAHITHKNDEAYIGSLAVVIALRRAAVGLDDSNASVAAELPDSNVRDNVLRAASLPDLAAVAREIGSSGFVAETIPMAFELTRRMRSIGIDSAMAEMNKLGGDTDTIGSIAAQIFGASTDIDPTHLLVDIPGADRVIAIADRFARYVDRT